MYYLFHCRHIGYFQGIGETFKNGVQQERGNNVEGLILIFSGDVGNLYHTFGPSGNLYPDNSIIE